MSVARVNKTPGPLSGWSELPPKIIVMELVERVFVLALFVHFAVAMLGKAGGINMASVLIIFAETLPVVLVLSRGPSETLSLRPSDWLFGLAGTSAPLFAIQPVGTEPLVPIAIGIAVMFVGISFQATSKLFLGRSFGVVAANRGVKVAGPYRIVRHPIYAGYTITHLGFLLIVPCWQNLLVYSIGLVFQIVRINKEERVLSEDPAYRELKKTTRYRLLPGVY